jgi:hypothetical protein
MKKFLLSMIAVLIAPITLFAGEITVTGTSVVSMPATTGYITVAVVTEAKTPADALALNKDATTNIFALLKKLNIKKEEMQTQGFQLSPKFVYIQNQEATLTGYTVKYTLQITVCDIANTGKVLDSIVKEGANRVEGVRFGVTDDKMQEALTKARTEAAKNAREKALLFASALNPNAKLKLKTLSEHSADTGNRVYSNMADRSPGGSTNIEGGEISVKVQVQTVWDCD